QMLETQHAASRRRYLPFITTLHGTDITLVGLDRSYLPITQFGIEQSDGVTAISAYLRNRTLDAFNIHNEIEVIHNFVNCDVNVLLPLADLMLMPSEMESFGLAALEAMACSVPPIATQVGGVPELIEHGINGLLFPIGDVESMAAAAISLLQDEPRLQAMAQA